jgi:hypothetical protein
VELDELAGIRDRLAQAALGEELADVRTRLELLGIKAAMLR